ncbi:hypothetical protein BHE74_00050171, partial [Ensete ventricosum]
VKGIVTDIGEDMHCQFLEVIRILVDSYTTSGSQIRGACFSCIYRCSFLVNNAIEKVLCLTCRRERFLVVAAIRFMRTIVSYKVWTCILIPTGVSKMQKRKEHMRVEEEDLRERRKEEKEATEKEEGGGRTKKQWRKRRKYT